MNIFQNKTPLFKTYRLHVNVLEARHLEIANVNTIVTISVGDKIKHVHAKTKNTENPYFNHLFRFTYFEALEKFIKRRLRIAVYQMRCFKLIGLCDIELVTVWEQPGHQFHHKWAILIDPRDQFHGVKGYLKCNVQILTEGPNEVHPAISNDEIQGNLLIPYQAHRRQQAIYSVTIYRADGITFSKTKFGKEQQFKSLYVKVCFAGKTLKTTRAGDEQEWNQALNFIDAVPSLFQTITIELWDQKTGNFVGSSALSLKSLWLGNLPTFGPSFLYIFHSKTSETTGRVLISLSCQLIDRSYPDKSIPIEKVFPFDESIFPPVETYTTSFVIFQSVFFKKKHLEKCLVTLKHGLENSELTERNDETMLQNIAAFDLSWFLGVSEKNTPILQTSSNWPSSDYRERRNNQVKSFTRDILQLIQKRDKQVIPDLVHQVVMYCDKILKTTSNNYENDLDKTRKHTLAQMIQKTKSDVQIRNQSSLQIFEMLEKNIDSILELTNEPQPSFPDLEIALSKPSSKKLGATFIKPDDYLFSPDQEESGCNAGKLSQFFICDAKGKDFAVLDGVLWFGRQTHYPDFLNWVENEIGTGLMYFQLRVHIYQGTILPGSDASGLADPFVRILAFGQTRETQVRAQTLDPFWDETLVFSKISVHVKPEFFKTQSFGVIFMVFDYDGNGRVELIGRGVIYPKLHLTSEKYKPPKLKREPGYNYGEKTAEILMTAEIIEVSELEEEDAPESREKLFAIPDDIRPHFKQHTMEVIFWGIRNLKMPALPPLPTLLALIDCNGVRLESNTVRAFSSLNFQYQVQQARIFLPEENEYVPPITVFLYEFSSQKQANYKGCAILPFLTPFLTQSRPECPVKLEFNETPGKIVELDEKPDWWTKYYASKSNKRLVKKMQIYSSELEKHFDNFQDYLYTFEIKKGKTNLLKPMVTQEFVGNVKCAIRLNPVEIDSRLIASPQNHPLDFTARVYIVSACQLPQMDINGRCDPYIKLVLGKFTLADRKHYVYKETDPIFGKCFELKGTFPWDHTLKISVMDHDTCFADDLIGETAIDLENRYYTRHHASCGIADTYELTGYCQWRDLFKPSEILDRICRASQLELEHLDNAVKIGNCFFDQQLDKESVSLEILKTLEYLPNFGYKLVPEHVETRTLYHPKNPGIDQGKLEMWVDIFPGHINLPPTVDITPREPQELELRVIVWSTVDVSCQDTSLLTREKSSDIYVKAWLASGDASQQTDIHFRSVTGEGNFNWRFIFPFCYSQPEHKIIMWKRVPFSHELWKEKLPCVFEAQVWDNDIISDDFIGSLSLDLSNMPRGSHSARNCTLAMLDEDYPRVSLFKMKRTRGWWPFKSDAKISGKIDMELEIVKAQEAKKFPAGLGRQSPQPLSEPNRPGTSLIWALNPMKILKNLLFGNIGRKLQIIAGVSAIATFLLAGWLALPGILLNKLFTKTDDE